MSVAAGVADEERGMLDSLVDDKATAGALEPPNDVDFKVTSVSNALRGSK